MRFVKENAIVDEFLFCQEMKERTKAKDVFDLVNAFLRENSILLVRLVLWAKHTSLFVASYCQGF